MRIMLDVDTVGKEEVVGQTFAGKMPVTEIRQSRG